MLNIINWDFLIGILISACAALVAIVIHELSHGLVAYAFGDNTAKKSGRLSLNPLKHIDPIGALCLVFFRFGWAKPVPVNPYMFKNRKWGMVLVSLAGPLSNFLLAIISAFLLLLLCTDSFFYWGNQLFMLDTNSLLTDFLFNLTAINIGLGIFNLLPVPPLDGSKILACFLPPKARFSYLKFERYGSIVLFVAIYFLNLSDYLGIALEFIFSNLLEGIATIVL